MSEIHYGIMVASAGAGGKQADQQAEMEFGTVVESDPARSEGSRTAVLVTHDVRNLLAGAAGMTEMLEAAEADPADAACLRAIRRQIGHATTLLEDLIVRILLQPPPMAQVDLGLVALNANAHLLARAGGKLCVQRLEPNERVFVRGRLNDLERALCNLMWNALEAMHADRVAEVRLDLRWGRNDEGAFLEVRDYGPGLTEGTLCEVSPGIGPADGRVHGLGLASVRQVMEEHGGRLTATNAGAGGGAVLRLQFGTQPELQFEA